MASMDLPSFHGMIGRSAVMKALFRRIERVAPIDVPVLIVGESGTGKELVARAIQQLSRRSSHRFETVNCAALTRELLLSELFGHERGSFTGAFEKEAGLHFRVQVNERTVNQGSGVVRADTSVLSCGHRGNPSGGAHRG